MKRKIVIIGLNLFFVSILTAFLSSPAYSFWYGDISSDGDPIVLDSEFDLPPNPTCDELSHPAIIIRNPPPPTVIDPGGAREQINTIMRGFSNAEPGDDGVSIMREGEYWDGVQLLSCVGGCSHPDIVDEIGDPIPFRALLIDLEGNFINGWENINAIPAKLLPKGYIMGGRGGGFGGSHLIQQDWCGNEVWAWEVVGGNWHHDFNRANSWSGSYAKGAKPKFKGKTLVLAGHTPEDEYDYPDDWVPEGHPAIDTSAIYPDGLIDDAIYIIDKNNRLLWQWFAVDHIEQMEFSSEALDGIYTVNVGRSSRSDWTHFNNVNWLGPNKWYRGKDDDGDSDSDSDSDRRRRKDPRFHPENIIFDSRTNGMIGIIDHKTGDIVWKIGPMFGPGTPFEDANPGIGPIIGPHNAHMIPKGLPGEGNIIVFDNGGNSGYGELSYKGTDCGGSYPVHMRDYARILEINPKTYEVVWEYKNTERVELADGTVIREFFSTFISGVQRTPKGTTIITEGNQARIFEVNFDGEIVWEYNAAAQPGGPGVIGRALYRSYRYPKSWVPKKIKCDEPDDGDSDSD